MVAKHQKYSPEFREEAARMVVEGSRAIAQVARELGLSETSLGNWVRAYWEAHATDEPPLELSERVRLRELERQNRELEMENADCFNREVIGYAMTDHMRTSLVSDALDMAARNHRLAVDCIFHSDHGTQYTSAEFGAKLASLHLRQSMGRTGCCYDCALAESFLLPSKTNACTAPPIRH